MRILNSLLKNWSGAGWQEEATKAEAQAEAQRRLFQAMGSRHGFQENLKQLKQLKHAWGRGFQELQG